MIWIRSQGHAHNMRHTHLSLHIQSMIIQIITPSNIPTVSPDVEINILRVHDKEKKERKVTSTKQNIPRKNKSY